MSKRTRIGLFVGLLVVVAALVFAATRSREPVYEGKKLSEWLAEGYSQDVQYASSPEARIALRQMGTNTLPFLLDMLRSQDSRVKLKLREWCYKQDIVNVKFHDSEEDRRLAISGFYSLGDIAKPAIPALSLMLNNTNHMWAALNALSGIGSSAIPVFTNAYSSTNQLLREFAIWGLVEMHTNAESVLPLLISSLHDTNVTIRRSAASSMFFVGKNQPALVIPALINSCQDSDRRVRLSAIRTLGKFGNEAERAVPKLVEILGQREDASAAALALVGIIGTNKAIVPIAQSLAHQSEKVQGNLIEILGWFKEDARAAILYLLPFSRSENDQLRGRAVQALILIGAESKVLLPILIRELWDTDTPIRTGILQALSRWGPEAKTAAPMLMEQIEILNRNEGRFPASALSAEESRLFDQKYGTRFISFSPLDSDEYKTLQKIDPEAAAKIKKQILNQEAKSAHRN